MRFDTGAECTRMTCIWWLLPADPDAGLFLHRCYTTCTEAVALSVHSNEVCCCMIAYLRLKNELQGSNSALKHEMNFGPWLRPPVEAKAAGREGGCIAFFGQNSGSG